MLYDHHISSIELILRHPFLNSRKEIILNMKNLVAIPMTALARSKRNIDVYTHVILNKYGCLYPYIQKLEVSVPQRTSE
jgi:hypothetical protein